MDILGVGKVKKEIDKLLSEYKAMTDEFKKNEKEIRVKIDKKMKDFNELTTITGDKNGK